MQTIVSLGKKARDSTLSIDEMSGGTFTISNGGVYGSLLSTPIINPPQSAIMGMHSIQQRPMVVGGEIKARPMMYIALTYDHRLIDGREVCLALRGPSRHSPAHRLPAPSMMPLVATCSTAIAMRLAGGCLRITNAKDAVQAVMFLRRVKDVIEDPRRLLLDI